MSKKKTHDEFLREMAQVNPKIIIKSEYDGGKTKVECECSVCGNTWNALPGHLLRGHGCRKCANQALSEKRLWTHEQFLEELSRINDEVIIRSQYLGAKEIIECECATCGNTWTSKPARLLSGHGCRKCGYIKAVETRAANGNPDDLGRRLTQEEFEHRLHSINPNLEILGKYRSLQSEVQTKCSICENVWSPRAGNLLSGYGCPNCNHASTSFPEQYIYYLFVSLLGKDKVFSRDKTTIGHELDIYIPSLNLAIEYGSWHWHYNKLENDRKKAAICKNNNITLITIIDNCPDGFHDSAFWCYTQKIERCEDVMSSLVQRLLDVCGLSHCYNRIDFEKIESMARNSSRKKSTEEFRKQVAEINSQIRVLGDYSNSSAEIKSECLICGYIWYPLAGNLLSGSGCPKCSGRKRLTQEEFLSKLHDQYPDLITNDKYINSQTELSFHCNICSSDFRKKPSNLWGGVGCPVCSKKQSVDKSNNRKIEKLRKKLPNVSIVFKRDDEKRTVLCSCNLCGYEWFDTYEKLMERRSGCPKCSRTTDYLRKNFANEISSILPNVKVLNNYNTSKDPIYCQCDVCKYEWKTSPLRLLQGKGCPYCDGLRRRVAQYDGESIIAVYESVTEAAKAMNTSKEAIWNCCNKKTRTSSGYIWKYLD